MRVAPRELRAIRGNGMLVRFAMLGPVAYVEVEIPPEGSAGSGFEAPSQQPGWGFVLRGEVALHGAVEREFPVGTAFYIPPGAPDHWLSATGGTLVAGFVPVSAELDDSEQGLRRRGYSPVAHASVPSPLPRSIRSLEPSTVFREPGSIEVETAPMGEWLFMRSTFGPLSGYTSGWCDLPHWGLVLRGDFALSTEAGVELLSAGDVYYCPAGPPAHQFQVADSATTIDYTPFGEFGAGRRMSEWRRAAWTRHREAGMSPSVEDGSSVETFARRPPDAVREADGLPSLPGLPGALPVALSAAPASSSVRWVRAPARGPRPAR